MTRRSSAAAFALFLGLLLGLAGPLASGVAEAQTATIRDIATDATDASNNADTEPSIAVDPRNPRHIAVVSFSGNWGAGTSSNVWQSTDGGVTWTPNAQVPAPSGNTGPRDQKIAFDANGKLLFVALDSGLNNFVYRQTGTATGGLTAGAAFGAANADQPHLDFDRVQNHNCSNRLYSPWLNTGAARNQSNVDNSVDSGVTTTNAAPGNNATFANRSTRMAVAPDGSAYIIYKTREGFVNPAVSLPGSPTNDFENVHFVVQRSDDCGATWNALGSSPVSIHGTGQVQTLFTTNFGITAAGRKVGRARSSDAWIAVDPSDGDVYAAFVQRDASGFAQIYVARSIDHGATWSTRVVPGGKFHSAYPEIAVAANGAIGVLYVDFQARAGRRIPGLPPIPSSTLFRHRFARSFDNGVSWTIQTLQNMDVAPIANAASGFLWGDYEGLTAAGNAFFGVFCGLGTGRTTPQLDPIFFTDTAVGPPPDPVLEACLAECRADRDDCMSRVGGSGHATAAQCAHEFVLCRQRCARGPLPGAPPRLTVTNVVIPASDPGRFDLRIDGVVRASGTGNGGTTGVRTVTVGAHTVSETAAAGTVLTNYTTSFGGACSAAGSIVLVPGDADTCVVTNVRKPPPPPPETRQQCLNGCASERDDCMADVAHGGSASACVQAFNACKRRCPP